MDIRPYENAHAEQWDRYVQSHAAGTVFHRLAWSRAVRKAYNHRPLHLLAWDAGRITGLLPMFLVDSLFVGRVLVSVPYATYGGIISDSDPAAAALLEAARELSRRHDVEYLELRHRDTNSLALPAFGRYDTFRKQLPDRPEQLLESFNRKARAATRKGLKALEVQIAPDLIDTVYSLYSYTMRRLGSPNYSRGFFRELQRQYADDCVCLVVRDAGRPVAGVISFVFRDEIVPYFSGSRPEGMRKHANNVMYLKLMEYAIGRGLRMFDFNRTRRDNHGPHAFKRYHGFQPQPLHYQVLLNRASQPPNLTPGNKKFALAGRIWRKMPLSLTRYAGAKITKWIP